MAQIPAETRVLSVLTDLIDELKEKASPATVRQRHWAISQAVEFYARTQYGKLGLSDLARVRIQDILSPASVDSYLQAAAAGALRARAGSAESPRSTSARSAALRWLSKHTDHTTPAAVAQNLVLNDTGPAVAADILRSIELWSGTGRPFLVRTAAAVAVLTSTAASTTQIVTLQTSGLTKTRHGYRLPADPLTPQPRTFTQEDDGSTTALLHNWVEAPLLEWLSVRKQLVDQLEGTDPGTLFVTVRANNRGTPPGLPLSIRGLTAAYTAALTYLEWLGPELSPPKTLETVRRAALSNFLPAG